MSVVVGVFDVKSFSHSCGVEFRIGADYCQLSCFDFRDNAARFQCGSELYRIIGTKSVLSCQAHGITNDRFRQRHDSILSCEVLL